MTRSPAVVHVGLRSGRWLLPWVVIAFVSIGLAWAMNNAAIGGSSAGYQQPDVQGAVPAGEAAGAAAFERSTTSPAAASAESSRWPIPDRCAESRGRLYVGVDWWIVAESRGIKCEPGAR